MTDDHRSPNAPRHESGEAVARRPVLANDRAMVELRQVFELSDFRAEIQRSRRRSRARAGKK
jgi:hypothetical protein